jgi:hypothetical protein
MGGSSLQNGGCDKDKPVHGAKTAQDQTFRGRGDPRRYRPMSVLSRLVLTSGSIFFLFDLFMLMCVCPLCMCGSLRQMGVTMLRWHASFNFGRGVGSSLGMIVHVAHLIGVHLGFSGVGGGRGACRDRLRDAGLTWQRAGRICAGLDLRWDH